MQDRVRWLIDSGGLGFVWVWWCRGLRFRGLGFRDLGFRDLGFRDLGFIQDFAAKKHPKSTIKLYTKQHVVFPDLD